MSIMKAISLAILLGCTVLLTGCETTDNANAGGTQEAKRRAAIERHRQQQPIDEEDANLWRAQENILNRDSNPTRAY
jgi:hypothetical protein